jgi:prolipoprotein diacylglyceryl transferase
VLKVNQGGLSSHGAALGLLVAMWLFTKRRAIALLEGTDRLVPCAALASILMRIGNLFNSEIVGKPTDGSWGIAFPRYHYDGDPVPRHPSQLYEIALGVALLLLLRVMDRRWGSERRPRGALTGLFLVAYSSGRFVVEFWKEHEGPFWLVSTPQWLSLPGVVLGIVVLVHAFRAPRPAGWRVGVP